MGLEGRSGLLSKLGEALRNKGLFGLNGRPGHMLGNNILGVYREYSLIYTRLPSFTPINPSLLRPHHHRSYLMGRPYQRPRKHMADITYTD